ncbi:MAG: ThiF family adenylyltransferase [Deltaproteobacteria bacterium]|nr:ThiF family adenylyltransferase [Deltaproteobacteria bacterium]
MKTPTCSPETFSPLLRDGVDVYFNQGDEVTFVYLATRKRLYVACEGFLQDSLAWLTGRSTLTELLARLPQSENQSAQKKFLSFIDYLFGRGIVVDKDWINDLPFPPDYLLRLERHMNFLLDLCGTPDGVVSVQESVCSCTVGLVGVGAVGGWLCAVLPMMGFGKFILIDPAVVGPSSLSRHAFHRTDLVGMPKVQAAEAFIKAVDLSADVRTHQVAVIPETDLSLILGDASIIINTADEPYIGHLNIVLGRFAFRKGIPFFAGGGFDAHLGCAGELLVKGKTPCADCYSAYFKQAVADWKPVTHPVHFRRNSFGGLPTLAAFSAFSAAIALLRYFIDGSITSDRTELYFQAYKQEHFKISKRENCKFCNHP